MDATLTALRDRLTAMGATAGSPLVLDETGEQIAREERWA